jgi:hypothetical protein
MDELFLRTLLAEPGLLPGESMVIEAYLTTVPRVFMKLVVVLLVFLNVLLVDAVLGETEFSLLFVVIMDGDGGSMVLLSEDLSVPNLFLGASTITVEFFLSDRAENRGDFLVWALF